MDNNQLGERNEIIKKSLLRDVRLRWIVGALVLPIAYIYFRNNPQLSVWPIVVLYALLAASNVAYIFLIKNPKNFLPLYYSSGAMDIILTTFAVYYTGKSSSPLVFIYFLIVLSSIFDVLIEYVYYYLIVIIGVCYMSLYLIASKGHIFTADIYIYLAQFGLLAFVGFTGNQAAKRMAGHYTEIEKINAEKEGLLETVKKANIDLEEKVKRSTTSLANTNLVLVKKNISLLAVHEIYKTADDANTREELLNMALGIIVPLMKGTGGIILTTGPGRNSLKVEVYKNIIGQDAISGRYEWTISQDSEFNEILKKKRTMFFKETSQEKDPILKEIIKDGSCIAAPLVSEGKTSGLIIVFSKEVNIYNKNDMELIEILGEQIGVLLHNRLMYEDMRSKADGMEKLMKLTLNIGSSLNMNEIIRNSLTESIRKLFLSSAGTVMLVDERNALRIKAQYGLNDDIINRQVPENSIAGWVYKNNRNLFIKDCQKLKFYNADSDDVYLKKIGIISPVYQKGKVMGVICMTKSKGEYKREDLYLLTVLSSHIGGSIEIVNLYEDVKEDYINTIYALAAAVDAKDHYTHGHSTTVMKYSTKMAEAMKLSDEEIENIKYAALLHDIGKIGISENIINKPSKLTKEEYAVVKMHPQMGANIISKIESLKKLAPLVVGHHEWINGSGYPGGLRGEEIPLGARIISIADAYSTMTSNRPYRAAMSMQESIKELEKFAGTQFDAKIVNIFAAILKNEEKEEKGKKETPAAEDKKDKKRLRITLEGDVNNPDIVSRDEKFYS